MAVTASRVTVTTSATLIATNAASSGAADSSTLSYGIKNRTRSASVFLGPSGVTTSSGWEWEATDGPISIDLEPGESLYGVVSAGTQTVHVMGAGR